MVVVAVVAVVVVAGPEVGGGEGGGTAGGATTWPRRGVPVLTVPPAQLLQYRTLDDERSRRVDRLEHGGEALIVHVRCVSAVRVRRECAES